MHNENSHIYISKNHLILKLYYIYNKINELKLYT